jgi:hypothetical protein
MTAYRTERRPELDALRGLFLVWMTLTHLPTRFSDYVNQPFGYISSAEGFVFLSALLLGRLSIRQASEDPPSLRHKLWKRSLRIYGYHLLLLVFAFTAAAGLAISTHRLALQNLLNFYLAHPVVAILGSLLLVYCPPLLDILPMYVVYLFFTPPLLSAALRIGWRWLLALSWILWLAAQFGLRRIFHAAVVRLTHLPIPLEQTGAFDLFAWQLIWISGLWLGARSAEGHNPLRDCPGWLVTASGAVCIFFVGVRHNWWGPHLTQQALGLALDKWSIGSLRLLNLIAFTTLFYWLRKWLLKLVSIEPFLILGKASLEVFCAHIVFVFGGLALLYQDMTQLHGVVAIALLAATLSGMMLVAIREVHKRHSKHQKKDHGKATDKETAPRETISKNKIALNQ